MAMPLSPKTVTLEAQVLDDASSDNNVMANGDLKFTAEKGVNSSKVTYQEASGAPVEKKSPLGYSVGWVTVVFLNMSKMIGTGVFSTPSTILKGTGSVGLSLIYWFLGFLVAGSSLGVYLEFASYFPSRSGSEVVYLEQAYPRPKYFFPTAFAVQSVVLSFSSSNAIVLAQYLFKLSSHSPSPWEQKGVAVAGYTVAVLFLVFSNRYSLMFSNAIGIVKLLTLIFISVTGLVVLGGHTSVKDPGTNFRHAFEGTPPSGYGVTNALVKVIFAYAGYENAFNMVNEVKNPIRTLRWSAPLSLFAVAVLYILTNIAFFSSSSKEDIETSKEVAASVFFAKVFGEGGAAKALNFLISLSAFGNLIAVLIGQSRLIRECGRQGVLPWPKFWASIYPFGTPLGPYFIKWIITILMILAPPAGDAFNFIVDLKSYPTAAFDFTMAVGLLLTRRRRNRLGIPPSEFRAWDAVVVFSICANTFLLVMPWYPPSTGRNGGDVSFWYATYCVVGIAVLVICGVYYWLWIHLLPKLGRYQICQVVLELDDGAAMTHKLIKVPDENLADWDAEHDATGRVHHRSWTEVK